MVQSFKEWVKLLVREGQLCEAYQDKIKAAHSKSAIMDICLDANGISYLCEMYKKGYGLPYDIIMRDFGRYFNGNYVSTRLKDGMPTYTGSIYCSDDNDTTINTTCTAFLGCVKNVFVKENEYAYICADYNSILTIYCPKESKCYIDCYGATKIVNANKYDNLIINYK